MFALFRRGWFAAITVLAGGLTFAFGPSAKAMTSRHFGIELTASTQESPPRITLNWVNNWDGQQYHVRRKIKTASAWEPGVVLSSAATSFTDTNVMVGTAYEYSISKYASLDPQTGYIFAGIRAP